MCWAIVHCVVLVLCCFCVALRPLPRLLLVLFPRALLKRDEHYRLSLALLHLSHLHHLLYHRGADNTLFFPGGYPEFMPPAVDPVTVLVLQIDVCVVPVR